MKSKPKKPILSADQKLELEFKKLEDKRTEKTAQIKTLMKRVQTLEAENAVFTSLSKLKPQIINVRPKVSKGKSESAAVIVWSDFHLEEEVLPDQVSDLNEYNLDVFDARFLRLLHGGLSWFQIESRRTTIKTIVLALLGDFITGSIHADLSEANLLAPAEAIYKAQNTVISGIKYMLENTPKDVEFIVPCHSGNHGRFTKEQRIATEAGNSLEYFMYLSIRDYFSNEKRIKFQVSTGYHSYVNFFDDRYTIRFHHGHAIRYGGGIGGLSIPANKAISQWDKGKRADLDVFGHWHQKLDGGKFICNGSLIGFNSYALSIKASYEDPSQTFFLVNREYANKTMTTPIYVSEPKW